MYLIFYQLCLNASFDNDAEVPLFKLTTFSDLLSKDAKKANMPDLVIPAQVRQIRHQSLPILYGIPYVQGATL